MNLSNVLHAGLALLMQAIVAGAAIGLGADAVAAAAMGGVSLASASTGEERLLRLRESWVRRPGGAASTFASGVRMRFSIWCARLSCALRRSLRFGWQHDFRSSGQG